MFQGWRVVAACFVIAAFAWALGLFGSSVYLQAVTAAHGWPIAEVASAITLFFLVSALVQRTVGRSIDRWGPRPVLSLGAVSMCLGVALIGQVGAAWQLYPCFVLIGIGWSTLSTTGIAATVAPWFERHQGRSMTLAIMGASVGAIVGVPLLLLAVGRFGLASGLIVTATVAALVLLPLIARALRFRSPAEIGQHRDGDSAPLDEAAPPLIRTAATEGKHRVLLWSAAVGFALGLTVQIGFITHHVTLAEPLLGTAGAGLLVSATGVTAFAGRLVLARIVDQVYVRRLAWLIMSLQTTALLAIALWPTAPVLIVASLVYGYGIGHVTTLGPVVVRREFGAAAFGATYGAAATVIQLTSAFGPALFGFLRDSFGGYGPGLIIASLLTAAGGASLLVGGRLGHRLYCRRSGVARRHGLRHLEDMDSLTAPASAARTDTEHLDVLIVGAGLSGIGAAWHLQDKCPGKSFAILEAREASGGTWDLFRYPGVRSDSDMYTLGYSFRPWKEAKAIADGPSILTYIREVARDHGIDKRIRFGHKVVAAAWSTPDARWTVEVESGPDRVSRRLTCSFLWMCSGYYDYEAGYLPEFAGLERFGGRIVHPQKWTDDIDYAGKRVVVIGSGATAVTLVPAMAEKAEHVTMLQRSPTYMVARPSQDQVANRLRRRLPLKLAYWVTRWRNVLLGMYFYQMCKRKPDKVKSLLLGGVRQMLGPDYDVDRHFTPRYNPWDQRLCLVPDADFFRAIRRGKVSIVTDQIETFTETGLRLESGTELAADLIVTATGLVLVPLGKARLSVDGRAVDPAKTFIYKGMMYSDVPNLASVFGYTNASWTLKADLVCEYVCRLINHMDCGGWRQCTPRNADPRLAEEPWVNFSSGYIQRALAKQPKQGSKRPWKLYQNYALDLLSLRFGSVRDRAMVFSR